MPGCGEAMEKKKKKKKMMMMMIRVPRILESLRRSGSTGDQILSAAQPSRMRQQSDDRISDEKH